MRGLVLPVWLPRQAHVDISIEYAGDEVFIYLIETAPANRTLLDKWSKEEFTKFNSEQLALLAVVKLPYQCITEPSCVEAWVTALERGIRIFKGKVDYA